MGLAEFSGRQKTSGIDLSEGILESVGGYSPALLTLVVYT